MYPPRYANGRGDIVNIEQSYKNLAHLLMNGRISLNEQPLTAVEHQQVNNDLDLIFKRALKADELQEEVDTLK